MSEFDQVFMEIFAEHPVGILFGIGFIVLVMYFGLSLLLNGWPKRRK